MIELTQEQIEDLSKLNTAQLGEKYGWASYQVSNLRIQRKIHKFPMMRRTKIPTPPFEELEGKTLQEVMKKYRVSRGTAIMFFRNRSIRWKRNSEAEAVGSAWLAELEEVKVEMKHLRMVAVMPFLTDAEIARAFNLSREWVGELRKKYRVSKSFAGIEEQNEKTKKEEKENGREGRSETGG